MFNRIAGVTIAAVYFLILVGAIVRASGAGMGCPDWPKCFGRWIPPTSEDQLPENYRAIYAERGYADQTFNVVKTWTEYINRLIGVTIGLLIFATLLSSFAYWKSSPSVVWLSLLAFLLVGFQGWLGSVVVARNIEVGMVTLHMMLALLLVAVLIGAAARANDTWLASRTLRVDPVVRPLLLACLGLSLIQVLLGTQVREQIDAIAALMGAENRPYWAQSLGLAFYVHRSLAILVLAANGVLAWRLIRPENDKVPFKRWSRVLLLCILLNIITGAALYYLAMPAVLQPLHLLLASIMFGIQFYLWIAYRRAAGHG